MRKSNVALRLQTSLLEEARRCCQLRRSCFEPVGQRGGGGKAVRITHSRTTSASDPAEPTSIRRSAFSDEPVVENLPLPVTSDK